jgi:hypothetical protein
METPKYLLVLWKSKWLLLVGLVVAIAGGMIAGFTLEDGQLVPRTEQSYRASTTVIVSSNTQPMYQAVIPGQEIVEGQTLATDVDLASKAILYAYLVSGIEMRQGVEAQIGNLAETEDLTALRRTTQPSGDENFPGRYTLPIIDVVGASLSPSRAEDISRTATDLFMAQVVAEQEAAAVPADERVTMTVLDQGPAVAEEGSNPLIPVVVTALGIFLLFVVAAFIIAGAKSSRAAKRAAAEAAEAPSEPIDPPRKKRSTARAVVPADDDSESAEGEREPARVG